MGTLPRFFGCHVSVAGGLVNGIRHGTTLGVNAIQVHPSAPQRWNTKPYPAGVEDEFLKEREASPVKRVFFHGIYLINLANPEKQKQDLAVLSLAHDLDLLHRIGGDGVIFHVGSMKDEPDEAVGLRRAAEAINRVFDKDSSPAKLLLEVAAGSGMVIGDRFEELAEIYSHVENKERLGFALDTQHLWASGYDLATQFDTLLDTIESLVGLSKLGAIHLNDSKTALASRTDRHENLGQGLIGRDTLQKIVCHPRLHEVPFILETPNLKDITTAPIEVAAIRSFGE